MILLPPVDASLHRACAYLARRQRDGRLQFSKYAYYFLNLQRTR
jgi:hypothetical protein